MADKPEDDDTYDWAGNVEVTEDMVVLCAPPTARTPFTDNRTGTCFQCAAEVVYRPHAERGKKLCMTCGAKHVEAMKRLIGKGRLGLPEELVDHLKKGWKP